MSMLMQALSGSTHYLGMSVEPINYTAYSDSIYVLCIGVAAEGISLTRTSRKMAR